MKISCFLLIPEVPVGKHSLQVTAEGYKVYTDELIEVFESQETRDDIDLTPEEPVT